MDGSDVFRKKYVIYVILPVFLLRGSMVSGPFTVNNKLKQVILSVSMSEDDDRIRLKELC